MPRYNIVFKIIISRVSIAGIIVNMNLDSWLCHKCGSFIKSHKDCCSEQVPCYLCDKLFDAKSQLLKHIRRCHEMKWQCSSCHVMIRRTDNIKKHEQCHEREKLQYKCFKCGQSFLQKYSLGIQKDKMFMIDYPVP